MSLKPGISGILICKDWLSLDYCGCETIRSMLPVCDEIIVSDGGSTDGTLDILEDWAMFEPKLRIVHHPESLWPSNDQVGNNWVNAVRKEARYWLTCWLDADEVLDPSGYEEMRIAAHHRQPRIFKYVNFWADAQHTAPWGDGIKLHLQSAEHFIHVHGKNPPEFVDIRSCATTHPSLVSYHYSALRKREAFVAKCKAVGLRHGFGYSAQEEAEAHRHKKEKVALWGLKPEVIEPFTGRHPPVMHQWLLDRGWKLE